MPSTEDYLQYDLGQELSGIRQFGEWWTSLLAEEAHDDLTATLRALKRQNCSGTFTGTKAKFCMLFQHLDAEMIAACDEETFRKLYNVRLALDQLMQADWEPVSWTKNVDKFYVTRQYSRYAHSLAERCSNQVYNRVKEVQPLHLKSNKVFRLANLFDLERDCRRSKKLRVTNRNVHRKDISSLECTIEITRRQACGPDKTNIMLQDNTLAKIRKIIHEKEQNSSFHRKNDIADYEFVHLIGEPCRDLLQQKPLRQAVLFYQSVILSDEYFASVPKNDDYFGAVRTALVCNAISAHYHRIREALNESDYKIGFKSFFKGKWMKLVSVDWR